MTTIDLPTEVGGPSAWFGPEVTKRSPWIHTFGTAEIAEIESAVRGWEAADVTPATLRRNAFRLPTVGPRLHRILAEVQDGCGFALLRGFPVAEWGTKRAALAFLGLGLHVGALRAQNVSGHLLGHVRDQGLSSRDPNVRIYQTSERVAPMELLPLFGGEWVGE